MAKNGKRKTWLWVSGVMILLLGGAAFLLRGSLKSDVKIDKSKLVTVEKGDLAKSVVATGKIEPRTKVEVKSKASGIVKKIYADYGDRVKAGQVLVELDKEDLQARLREARALVQVAEASEQSAQASWERNKVEADGPDVPFLKTAFDRATKLHKEGLIAVNILEESERTYQLAVHKQLTAQRGVAVGKADMARAKAQVAQARAALERAEEDLSNATIVSPMDGLVLSRNVEIGVAVSSILVLGSQATLVMTLGDVSDVYVLGKVDQADIGRVFLGQPARIVVESFKDRKFEGAVTKISPLGVEKDNVTTFEVRVSIKNPGGELKANMTANAEIILLEKKGILLVRESAVIYDRQRNASVEVPDPTSEKGKKKVDIKVGISNGINTELLAGLRDGQQVVLQ
ncbi:MAG: efflux RND transporter periplasmic adaptor subunit [Bryobacteraceae bacterium]|nr:efflux RND transporter periplasmic adaptor subunit [Bryobacteraceae bacterium]